MDTFDRCMLAARLAAAAEDPRRADAMLMALASWNSVQPATAVDDAVGWVESHCLMLVVGDWGTVRGVCSTAILRLARRPGPGLPNSLGLGGFGVGFDDIAVAVRIGAPRVIVTWMPRFQILRPATAPGCRGQRACSLAAPKLRDVHGSCPPLPMDLGQITRTLASGSFTAASSPIVLCRSPCNTLVLPARRHGLSAAG